MTSENSRNQVDRGIERLRRYADGAALIFKNAEALYEEAQLLGQAGHFARATVLHQISMEECSKIDTLGAAATSILVGRDVDEARLARAFRDHKAKNYANAYFAKTTDDEMSARERGDWEAASEAFKQVQSNFHTGVNTVKNAGLYVDFKDGRFITPLDEVDEPTAVAFQQLNAYFLTHGDNFLRLLHRMVSEPNLYAELMEAFVRRAQALRAAGDLDPQQIQDALMEDLRTRYASRSADKN